LLNAGPLPPFGMLVEAEIVMLLVATALERVATTVQPVVTDVEVCVRPLLLLETEETIVALFELTEGAAAEEYVFED
jgi:hypothetical protein